MGRNGQPFTPQEATLIRAATSVELTTAGELNAAIDADKQELDQLWRHAAADVLGVAEGPSRVSLSSRFSLEKAPELLGRYLVDVRVMELPGTIKVTDAEPVVAHLASYEAWADQLGVPFASTLTRARELVEAEIADQGSLSFVPHDVPRRHPRWPEVTYRKDRMSTAAASRISIERYTDLAGIRQVMLDVYADVRHDLIHLPHYSVDSFAERLDRHATDDGWEVVIGYDGVEPIGYAYGSTVLAGNRWWTRMDEPLPEGFDQIPTLALKELGVRPAWRETGASRLLHDALLAGRTEHRVTLLVNPKAGDGKVQALYANWGYEPFNHQTPSPGSPALTAMIRGVQTGELQGQRRARTDDSSEGNSRAGRRGHRQDASGYRRYADQRYLSAAIANSEPSRSPTTGARPPPA